VETPAAGSYTESTLTTSQLNFPGAIRVDARGNLYILDTFNFRLLKETSLGGGTYAESVVATSALEYPYGVAIDGNSNIYIGDTFHNRVIKEDLADTPSLSFAATSQFATSSDSPRVITASNYGNSTLQFSLLSYPTDFPESIPAVGDCNLLTSLGSSASCTFTINFSPIAPLGGNPSAQLTEAVSFTTNVTTTPQAINVTGTELQP
jgi:hypothetical protein